MAFKPVVLAVALLTIATHSLGQAYMDNVAKSTCECVAKIPDTTPANDAKAQVGICILQSLPAVKDKVRADFGLDVDNIAKDGERLGQLVATRMITQCPASLTRMSRLSQTDKPAVVENTIEGVVSRIEKDFFVAFSVKDGAGKTVKLYWMSQVTSGIDLINGYDSLLGKTVKVSYQPREFFDPKISDYRQFNVITKIW